ncbi:MAG: hypothetical protein V4526_01340 [Patescibacteria group bacterium]
MKVRLFSIFFVLILIWLAPQRADAAALILNPAAATPVANTTFQVSLGVDYTEDYINAVSATISYTTDTLELVSISKNSSILNLWVREPTYSNQTGKAELEGVIFNPGYKGSFGNIATLTFRAKKPGSARVSVSEGSVLANDGKGTNVLKVLGYSTILVSDTTAVPGEEITTPASTSALVPVAPKITSASHPDSTRWYNTLSPEFAWNVSSDVTAARLQFDARSNSTPGVLYEPAVSSKKLDQVKDGSYYFHVQLRNAYGWGGISHYKFQTDTVPPLPFTLQYLDGKQTENARPRIGINAKDELSGIDRYIVKINNDEPVVIDYDDVDNGTVTLSPLSPGKKTILVKAVDRAGNETASFGEFEIQPIESPVITDYTTTLEGSEPLKITGTTYPNATVAFEITDSKGRVITQSAKSNAVGEFIVVVTKDLSSGAYAFKAKATDIRGGQSLFTDEYSFVVNGRPLSRFGTYLADYATIVIVCLLIVVGLSTLMVHLVTHMRKYRKKIRRDIQAADRLIHEQFEEICNDIEKQVKTLEKVKTKRELTKEEDQIIASLKKYVRESEKKIAKKIADVEEKA